MKYEQLPLTGETNDYQLAILYTQGYAELCKAIIKFYRDNSKVNPRQLHYIIATESEEAQLDTLLNLR